MIEVEDKYKCCGCSACVQKCPMGCISMVEDEEGFQYPKVNQKDCVNCGLCERVCPLRDRVERFAPIGVLAAFNKNEEIRLNSSSGGIFSLLAERIINKGGVVFGAKFNDQWDVILDYSETINGLASFRGSKYVQASVENTFEQCEHFLKQGKNVLFSGTPCQIAGLKQFLARDYDNLLAVDVVCHGVPSPMIWRLYLKELINKHNAARKTTDGKSNILMSQDFMSSIKNIEFRNKSGGWKKFSFVINFTEVPSDGNHSTVFSSISESCADNVYMNAFLTDLIIRPSCFRCPFRGKEHRQSDLSIADFWGVDQLLPDMDDDKGTSLVMINTAKGLNAFCALNVSSCEVDLNDAIPWNAGLMGHLKYNGRRDHFYGKMKCSEDIIELMKVHTLPEIEYQKAIAPIWRKIAHRFKIFILKQLSIIFRCV